MTMSRRKGRSRFDWLSPDIFGSDLFVQYSRTYVWQANQIAHFALGLGWASVCSWSVRHFQGCDWLLYVYGLCAAGIGLYVAKEIIDFLIAKDQATGFYELDLSELWRDMLADIWFVASGILTASLAYLGPQYGLVMAGVAVASFLLLRQHFLPAKTSLDRTALPYMFRLCKFPITDGIRCWNLQRIRAFISDKEVCGFEPSSAVLIQGYRGAGKTALGVGIGSEYALRKKNDTYGRSLYITAFSLLESAGQGISDKRWTVNRRKMRFLGGGDPWCLDSADMLIIDDVDSSMGSTKIRGVKADMS